MRRFFGEPLSTPRRAYINDNFFIQLLIDNTAVAIKLCQLPASFYDAAANHSPFYSWPAPPYESTGGASPQQVTMYALGYFASFCPSVSVSTSFQPVSRFAGGFFQEAKGPLFSFLLRPPNLRFRLSSLLPMRILRNSFQLNLSIDRIRHTTNRPTSNSQLRRQTFIHRHCRLNRRLRQRCNNSYVHLLSRQTRCIHLFCNLNMQRRLRHVTRRTHGITRL